VLLISPLVLFSLRYRLFFFFLLFFGNHHIRRYAREGNLIWLHYYSEGSDFQMMRNAVAGRKENFYLLCSLPTPLTVIPRKISPARGVEKKEKGKQVPILFTGTPQGP